MEKTLHIQMSELIDKIVEAINGQRVDRDIYGTSREDAFLSGINEGLDRALDALKEFEI